MKPSNTAPNMAHPPKHQGSIGLLTPERTASHSYRLYSTLASIAMGLLGSGTILVSGCSSAANTKSFEASSTQDAATNATTQAPDAPSSESSDSSSSSGNTETSACEEGELRDCSELPDGTKLEFPSGVAQGNCKKGHQRCKDGAWQPCQDAVGPAPKDRCELAGDDANCNAIPNEGCECTADQNARTCGVSDIGACELGLQACVQGAWQECEGEIKPQREACDNKGVDEDCDGKVDLQDEDCECIDQDQELCSIPAKGDCSLGKRVCKSGKWGSCQPRFAPTLREICGGFQEDELGHALGDEDCDGKVDNHPINGPDPINCEYYMIDADQDGFGAIGNDYADDQVNYSYGCFCKGKAPSASLVHSPEQTHNQDCGDCEVEGELVHPAVTEYFNKPSTCLQAKAWEWGAFDYDCNKDQAYEYSSVSSCDENDEGSCVGDFGHWDGNIPDCGQRGRRGTTCMGSIPPCELELAFSVELQACR